MRKFRTAPIFLVIFVSLIAAEDTCKITESCPKGNTKGNEIEYQSERGEKCRVYRVKNQKALRMPVRWKGDGDVYLDLVLPAEASSSVTQSFGKIAKGETLVCTAPNRDECTK